MTNPYGPWATAINAGRNPQLSAFWRQRLTMLVPASRTSPMLSRRNLLGLVAAAALVCALPTFHTAPAVAEQEKGFQETNASRKTAAGTKDATPSITVNAVMTKDAYDSRYYSLGAVKKSESSAAKSTHESSLVYGVIDKGDSTPSNELDLPTSVSSALDAENSRKDLDLTSDQEKKLTEISRNYWKQLQESVQTRNKEVERLSAEERVRKQREDHMKSAQMAKSVRMQVQKLLTEEQWVAVKSIAMGTRGVWTIDVGPAVPREGRRHRAAGGGVVQTAY